MASIGNGIVVKKELRTCIVDKKKGLFHQWVDKSNVIGQSALAISHGGHNGGQISYTVGLVEHEDGTIHEYKPTSIKFTDNKSLEYHFEG